MIKYIITTNFEQVMTLFIATITYLLLCYRCLTYLKQKKYKRTQKFIKTISIGLKNKTINCVQDVNNIYMGIFGVQCDTKDSVYCGQLCKLLRKLLVKVINNGGEVKELSLENEQRNEIKEKLSQYIDHFEKTYPFANLPLAEMNIMNDISTYILNKDIDSITRKINELAGIIQVRTEENKKLNTATKWSIPLAIAGLIFTIIFGIISFFK